MQSNGNVKRKVQKDGLKVSLEKEREEIRHRRESCNYEEGKNPKGFFA
jgi:hypothetical protein